MTDIEQDWFVASDDRPIFFRRAVPEAPRAVMLMLHGLHEHSGRYAELMEHFAGLGFAVYAEDHRGHGRTARTLGDLESVDAIVGDIGTLHRNAMTDHPGLPVFVFGHSMGGLLGVLYAQRTPGLAGAIFNGAAMDIPDDVPAIIVKAAGILGVLTPRLPVQPFYDPEGLCDDPARIAAVQVDPLYYKGKLRARTGKELLGAIRTAVKDLPHLRLPMLVTHGTADHTVPPRTSEILYGAAASEDKELHWFDGMLHEVHNMKARDEVIARWTAWLEPRL
ncbi:MAG: lysophospholipase [Myxococcales bacterium]|nr:lysophospholipase [Myxococcales bacterium]MCB9693158.1 lysophospholipase [Alphaproteobacteria bacterium]